MSTYQVRSLQEADQIIREHERKSKTSFSLLRSTNNFGCMELPACTNEENEVRFETVGVPYCGVPFFIAGLKILQCQSFKARGPKKKQEVQVETNDYGNGSILASRLKTSKRIPTRGPRTGCTATIIMKEVIYYPEFQLFEHCKASRLAAARQLREVLKQRTEIQKDRIIYVTVPAPEDHFGHSVNVISTKNPNKKVFVKSSFYGCNSPGSSKRAYYPIKQEKFNLPVISPPKKVKVEEDDIDAKAREVREMLQSIMALTYKSDSMSGFNELLKDLSAAKSKFQQTMNKPNKVLRNSNITIVTTPSTLSSGATRTTTQVITIQPQQSKGSGSATSTVSTPWPLRAGQIIPASVFPANIIPGSATVVTVSAIPVTLSGTTINPVTLSVGTSLSSLSGTTVTSIVTTPNSATTSVSNTTTTTVSLPKGRMSEIQITPIKTGTGQPITSDAVNNQETSIFIEAMEAIFNSQM